MRTRLDGSAISISTGIPTASAARSAKRGNALDGLRVVASTGEKILKCGGQVGRREGGKAGLIHRSLQQLFNKAVFHIFRRRGKPLRDWVSRPKGLENHPRRV